MQAGGLQSADYDRYGQNGKFGAFNPSPFANNEYADYAATRSNPLPYFYPGA